MVCMTDDLVSMQISNIERNVYLEVKVKFCVDGILLLRERERERDLFFGTLSKLKHWYCTFIWGLNNFIRSGNISFTQVLKIKIIYVISNTLKQLEQTELISLIWQ